MSTLANPDYAVPPGEFLQEFIDDGVLSRDEVMEALKLTETDLAKLLDGRRLVDEDLAVELQYLTGIPAGTWLKYQEVYSQDLVRLSVGDC